MSILHPPNTIMLFPRTTVLCPLRALGAVVSGVITVHELVEYVVVSVVEVAEAADKLDCAAYMLPSSSAKEKSARNDKFLMLIIGRFNLRVWVRTEPYTLIEKTIIN